MIKESGKVSAGQVYVELSDRISKVEGGGVSPTDRQKLDAIPASASSRNPVALAADVPDITGLTQRVTDAEDNIDDIQALIPSGASTADPLVIQSQLPDITGLTQRVAAAEGDIDDIQGLIPPGASTADPLVIQSQLPDITGFIMSEGYDDYIKCHKMLFNTTQRIIYCYDDNNNVICSIDMKASTPNVIFLSGIQLGASNVDITSYIPQGRRPIAFIEIGNGFLVSLIWYNPNTKTYHLSCRNQYTLELAASGTYVSGYLLLI